MNSLAGSARRTDGVAMSSDQANTESTSEFAEAFAIAKEALGLVGKFRTPPTPEVYAVWYRFVEGKNEAIQEQLSHATNHAESVSLQLLENLHEQFCLPSDDASEQVSRELANRMSELGSLISSQLTAGDDFSDSINAANETLTSNTSASSEIRDCVTELLESNKHMQTQLQETSSRLKESQNQVAELRNDLVNSQKKVMTDPLTGVGNRRYFDMMMEQAVNDGLRDDELFLLLIDLDEFKNINDTFGHSAGDQVLKFVATETKKIRAGASIARYGGDEFAVFLETNEVEEATQYANEIRRFFATNSLKFLQTGEMLGRLGLSIGVARLRSEDDSESWFNRADQLLYRAKESGRNCVMVERVLTG